MNKVTKDNEKYIYITTIGYLYTDKTRYIIVFLKFNIVIFILTTNLCCLF